MNEPQIEEAIQHLLDAIKPVQEEMQKIFTCSEQERPKYFDSPYYNLLTEMLTHFYSLIKLFMGFKY